ncbi:uncharacterized protein TNCV_619481 [Trichonephila clavipes]|uniref:Uncharacterized protein n=1 Tax=Trichonephila clavipes TaxID=2585209 RepID=A0A8X6S2D8_TRICX|nr:uncharacterized protein TNCV_619481 [Trichonephila clavipes]
MHRHTDPAPGIMVWGGIGYHSRTPLVRIAGTLNSQRVSPRCWSQLSFLTIRAWPQPFCKKIMHDHVARIVQKFFVNLQIELLPWPAHSLSGFFGDRKHVVHGCSTIDPDYTPSCHTRSTFPKCGIYLVCCTPRRHPKSL